MTSLDIRTLSFLATLGSLLLAVGLQVVHRVMAQDPSLRLWATGATINATAYVLLALRGVLPDVLSIVVGNTLLVVGSAWLYRGNCQYQGCSPGRPWYWPLAAATALLLAYFSYVSPNLSARIVVLSAATALVSFLCGYVLVRPGESRDRTVRWCVAAIFLVTAIFMGLRALLTFLTAAPGQDFMALTSPVHTFSLVIGIGGYALLGIGLPLLVAGRVQRQLMESESRFRGAFESAAHGMALVSTTGQFNKVNAALCHMLGYSEAELLATDFQSITHAQDIAVDEAQVHALLAGSHASYQLEKRYIHKSRSILWVQLSVSLVRARDGTPVHFVAQVQDITERKSASQRMQTLMDTASDGIHVLDPQGNVVQFSPSFARMLGYSVEEVAQLNVRDWDAQMQRDVLGPWLAQMIRTPTSFEARHRRKDGALIDVEIKAQGVVLDGREYLYASARDISERKLYQHTLEQLIAEQKAMLENELICIAKVQGRTILWANRGCEYMLGYAQGELAGMDTRRVYPSDEAYQALAAAADPVLARGQVFRAQVEMRRQDGSLIWVEVSGAFLNHAEEASLWGFMDVTERRRQERRIQQNEQRLELALAGADLAMWDLDLLGDQVTYHPRLLEMLGYAPDELEVNASTLGALLHPEDRLPWRAAFQAARSGAESKVEIEYRLRHKAGHWRWVRCLGKVVERDANGQAVRMVGTHADISERKISEAKIHELAFYDALTHLPNRRLLLDRLGLALPASGRRNAYGAVLFLDLDNFKTLNDTHGHDFGDLLLQEVARRLLACVRSEDTVARLGGDEFVVMLEDLAASQAQAVAQVQAVSEKIREVLAQVYVLGPYHHHCTCSIGVSLFQGSAVSVGDVIKFADQAMYQAKTQGRNTVRFHGADRPSVALPA